MSQCKLLSQGLKQKIRLTKDICNLKSYLKDINRKVEPGFDIQKVNFCHIHKNRKLKSRFDVGNVKYYFRSQNRKLKPVKILKI